MNNEIKKTPSFSSKVGLIMATAGSAVGLGNIWKFPYIAGENGGGAFLIIYLVCVLLFGMPLLITEFYIGKHSGKSAFGAFRALRNNGRWQWLSWLCMLTSLIIMGFYFVVTGWCFHYVVAALTHTFKGMDSASLTSHFEAFSSNGLLELLYGFIAVLITVCILWFDVNKGIERLSKILMPLLLIMMILMAGRVLMLDGSSTGMRFFFQADFSKLTPQVVLSALGQCFFSLSIGMGVLITYGAYMPKNQNLTTTSLQVAVIDTIVAVFAGMIIFPAVFAFGFNPAEGPELVFVVLPAIFEKMSFAWFSSILFFLLLCVAALTSTISLMEVVVAFLTEATAHTKHPLDRHKSVIVVFVLVMAMISACIFLPYVFKESDVVSSCILMPLNALAIVLFVGWFLPKKDIQHELCKHNDWRRYLPMVYIQIVRYLVPLAIIAIFLNGIGIW